MKNTPTLRLPYLFVMLALCLALVLSAGAAALFEAGSDYVEEEAIGAGEYDPVYAVSLKVVGAGNDVLFNGVVSLKSPTKWANEFLKAAITDKGLAQSGIEVGFVDTLGDYMNNSADGYYWLYQVNGESPMVGCNQFQLRDGDHMLWQYMRFEDMTYETPAVPSGDWVFAPGGDAVEDETAGAGEYDPIYTVNLMVVGADNDVLFHGTVTLKSPAMWANEFLRAAITDKGLAQNGIEIGFVDTLGDYVNNAADGIFWLYTVNGVSPMVGCNQYQLRDGDYMQWTYTAFEY